MTPEQQAGFVIDSLIAVGGMLFVAYVMWPRTRADRFREDLYKVRDTLFDRMVDQRHDFNDPAYGFLRRRIHGIIRLGPRVNAFVLLIATRSTGPCPSRPKARSAQLEAILKDAEAQLYGRLMRFMFLQRVSGWFVILCVVPRVFLARASTTIRERIEQSGVFRAILPLADDAGEQDVVFEPHRAAKLTLSPVPQ